jgi:hypothetical protein
MKKIKYVLFLISLVSAVGFAYATATLRGFPDTFDMEDEDE